jgi:ribosome-associated toxin RatA of RatAB toxin-antitoxin module
MAEVHKTVLVEHSAARMFDLVDRVEDYPRFLPWCGGTDVHSRSAEETVASIHIDYMGVKQHFTTSNRKVEGREMRLTLREGPFSRLEGTWIFRPLGEAACKIEFDLSYHFSSRLLETVLSPVFNYIANTFVEAFVMRADTIYGQAGG